MSFFHRPGDSSSDEASSNESEEPEASLDDASQDSVREPRRGAEVIEPDTPAESLSLTNTISNGEDGTFSSKDEVKDTMIAAMLEELSKYKAAELMNNANAGSTTTYDKNSAEVQEFAQRLYAESSGILEGGGLMSGESAGERKKSLRQQYLSALTRFSYQNAIDATRHESSERGRAVPADAPTTALVRRPSQQPPVSQGTAAGKFRQLAWEMENMSLVPRRPSTELQLAPIAPPIRLRSHYDSNFEERGLLGRGGFGRVYHTFNMLDQKDYAIKKIPLSPRLSQKYHTGGYQELAQILQEVQAMAALDHCNVVRYHATWIEEPTATIQTTSTSQPIPMLSHRGQMLLDNNPALRDSPPAAGKILSGSLEDNSDPLERSFKDLASLPDLGRIISTTSEEDADPSFDPFARSSNNEQPSVRLWSGNQSCSNIQNDPQLGGKDTTNLFSDVYVLHVQMSMYPLTLTDYLRLGSSPRRDSATTVQRHCFHLVPALRLLLGILCGLQYIHSKGFIHRDLKPSNIFLSTLDFATPVAFAEGYTDTGSCPSCPHTVPRFVNPRIGDFGLVAELEKAVGKEALGHPRDSSGSGKAVGTEYYRPPLDKHADNTVDERIDVFAIGVILLELLWSCGTRMERIGLLQGCQKGMMPAEISAKLETEGHSREIVNRVQRCISGMIDPDPKSRWRCAMVKNNIEEILARISEVKAQNLPE